MFDWDDEELTNIIWGEAGESDDHIVPYPEKIEEKPQVLFADILKKEASQGTSNVSFLEQKKANAKSEDRVELDSSPSYDTHDLERGCGLNSWPDGPDASLSNAAKGDQDSISAAASKDVTKSTKDGILKDEIAQFEKDSTLFQNQLEDREDGDFVDYDWGNIGSFEDLDKIFSNNEPVFGDISVGNMDELWLSTKDVTSTPLGANPLSGDSSDLPVKLPRISADGSETEAQYMLDPPQSFISGYEKLNEGTSNPPQNVQRLEMSEKSQVCLKQLGDVSAATANELPDEGNKQERLLKGQKTDKKSEVKQQQHDICSTWSSSRGPFSQVNQYRSPIANPCPPLVLSHQAQVPRPELLQQNHFSGPLLASPLYGSMVNHYPTPLEPAAVSGYEVPPSNANSMKKSVDASIRPPSMSPREKIEKLRRRQKMRAMLAIQRQQQQFGNQVTVVEHPTAGGKLEGDETLSNFPSIGTASPIDRDESNAISMASDNCSIEESVLRRLEDTIAKLDSHVRLSIRDSLYRLAQSAMQRQYPSVTISTSTSGRDVLSNQDINNHERFTRIPDLETDTNSIDRTVAHLLFHRPLEFSAKPAETPESPASVTLPFERMESSSLNLAHMPEHLENNQMTSPTESKKPHGLLSGDTPEIASTNDNGDGVTKIVEDSK